MYFPYLHGRQAELGAITDPTTDLGTAQAIFPFIEPVDHSRGLIRSMDKLKTLGRQVYLVTNPHQGDLRSPSALAQWSTDLAPYIGDASLVRPVLAERSGTTAADIATFAGKYPGRPLGLILGSTRLAATDVAAALAGTEHLVFLLPGVNSLSYATALGADKTVQVSDNFTQQARNADYSGTEWLGNNHLTYAAAGQAGFSDFTILPAAFVSGGGPVGAAALHLTFKEADDSFWVQHFVSDETDRNVGTSSSKLLEAFAHLQTQVSATPTRFEVSPSLDAYLNQLQTGKPTNLSGNKRLQVAHHIHVAGRQLGL